MGEVVAKVSIEAVLRGIGLEFVETVDPLDLEKAVDTVKRAQEVPGVKAIIFKSPCVAITKPKGKAAVDPDKCIGCRKCIRELGCPGLVLSPDGKKARIDASLCTGCSLCAQICPVGAIASNRQTVKPTAGDRP